MQIQWYPGHMTKTRRMMEETISLVDIVIELVDARIPYSSKNPDLDELAKNKHRILLLNKSDLADPIATEVWKQYFQEKGFAVIERHGNGRSDQHGTGVDAGKDREAAGKRQDQCADPRDDCGYSKCRKVYVYQSLCGKNHGKNW